MCNPARMCTGIMVGVWAGRNLRPIRPPPLARPLPPLSARMSLMGTKVRLAKFIADFNRTYGTAIPYNRGLDHALTGVIPAASGENNLWMVDPDCAPAVAAKLGLTPVAKDEIESPTPS